MKVTLGALVLISVLISSSLFMGREVINRIDDMDSEYSKRMGNKYILEGDTLTIVDYSLFSESFTLSNGVEIDHNLVIK